MQDNLSLSEVQKEWHGTLKHYCVGFGLSILLSGVAFGLVLSGVRVNAAILVLLAILQAAGQLIYFLHVGKEAKPRWETVSLLFMILVLVTIVLGSLWIMFDLNNRMMEGHGH